MHFKKFSFFGARTYKLQNGKSNKKEVVKVSAISLFEADSDNYLSNGMFKSFNNCHFRLLIKDFSIIFRATKMQGWKKGTK